MPNRMWWHVCGDDEVRQGARQCPTCGAEGRFDGWHLSMWEAAGVYHYVYELNPFGPHRPLAHQLLSPLRDECVRCRGRAILTVDEETWNACPTCEGTGGVWNRSATEVEAARREVVALWPGAALPWVNRRARSRLSNSAGEPPALVITRRPPRAARRASGMSPDGIKYDAVRRVFAQAERTLGTRWQLSGHGHCERVTLKAHYSRHARLGAPASVKCFCPAGCIARQWIYPAALVRRAASILKIDADVLVSRWL